MPILRIKLSRILKPEKCTEIGQHFFMCNLDKFLKKVIAIFGSIDITFVFRSSHDLFSFLILFEKNLMLYY